MRPHQTGSVRQVNPPSHFWTPANKDSNNNKLISTKTQHNNTTNKTTASPDSGGAAAAGVLSSVLDRSAPGVADAVLRAALTRTPLAMLEQPVAGVRGRSLLAAVPAAAAAEGVRALWPILLAHGAALPPVAATAA